MKRPRRCWRPSALEVAARGQSLAITPLQTFRRVFRGSKGKFAPWPAMMEFKRFDIEVNPLGQSFMAGSYDLIMAASCLHAAGNPTRP